MPVNVSFGNPFEEQLEFFKQKLNLPTGRWDDILKSAHDRAFVVAGAANADLLNDLRAAVTRSIEGGGGLAAFRKDFNALVLKNGWTGWTGEGTAAGQAWRTRVIYQTNMSTSYAAGRWKQLTNPELLSVRPYWRYLHSDAVAHPRPIHLSWNGLTLRYDHVFWQTHFAPNGWGCECRVISVDAKEYAKSEAAGRTEPPPGWNIVDPETGTLPGIDKGWDYAPGASTTRPLKDFIDAKLIKLDAPVGAAMYQSMLPVLRAERNAAYKQFLDQALADPVKRGRRAIVGAIDPATLRWLEQNKSLVPASAEISVQDGMIIGKKASRHQLAGDALTSDDWTRLPDMLERPDQILFDTRSGKLLYIVASKDGGNAKLAVEFDYVLKRGAGETNAVVSAFKVPTVAIDAEIKGGFFEVVK